MQNIKAFLSNLTTQPGVYQMLDAQGKIIYIGKARNLKNRISSYFSNKQQDIKTLALVKHIHNIDILVTNTENEALLLECNLIKKFKPHYNVLFRDDKSYPYIVISNERPYPSIDFYRGNKRKGGHFFGPYPDSTAVKETIHLIQKLFGLRLKNDKYDARRERPCLRYQLGLCSGSCAGIISPANYQVDVEHAILFLEGKNDKVLNDLAHKMEIASKQLNYEYAAKLRDQITQLRDIQSRQYVSSEHGHADVIGFAMNAGIACIQLVSIRGGRILGSRSYFPSIPQYVDRQEIITSFITQHYLNTTNNADIPKEIIMDDKLRDQELLAAALSEQAKFKVTLAAAVRGERRKWLEMANNTAQQTATSQLINKTNTHDRIAALAKLLELEQLPERIECFDISHSMGEATVGSCVVFNQEGPAKQDYRRFNITDITPGDDIAAMRQALTRRYKRLQSEEAKLPDVLLIDGGVAQLHAAQKVLAELNITSILMVGVAKGVTRKPGFETLHIDHKPPIHLAPDSVALHLIQQIRDEAHRFAITGHRMRRDKKRQTSTLEFIPGVGAKRRRELLRYFGGIQAINRASLEEIAKVPGISEALAERIFAALHSQV